MVHESTGRVYPDVSYNKLSLPSYTFEKNICWLDVPQSDDFVQSREEAMYYSLTWKPRSEVYKSVSSEVEQLVVIRSDGGRIPIH